MSWSYDVTQLDSSEKDQVRLMIGDTNADNPLVEDEEIEFYLSKFPLDLNKVALACLDISVSRITETPDYTLGPYSESTKSRLDSIMAYKKQLEAQVVGYHSPIMKPTTTAPIFGYGIASETCCLGEDNHE